MTARLILASASPRRRLLLTRLGLKFEVQVSGVPEDPGTLNARSPVGVAETLARDKARAVSHAAGDAVVVAADTIVVCDGTILSKPVDRADAVQMLELLSGRRHSVITAVAVRAGEQEAVGHQRTDVWFRPLTDREIEQYVDSGEPMDKAGAYGIQGRGDDLIERICGSYSNVVGLPLALTVDLLDRFGIRATGRGHDSGPGKGPPGGVLVAPAVDNEAATCTRQTTRATDQARTGGAVQRRVAGRSAQNGDGR